MHEKILKDQAEHKKEPMKYQIFHEYTKEELDKKAEEYKIIMDEAFEKLEHIS